jgi:iron complex outermembrane receptor protein
MMFPAALRNAPALSPLALVSALSLCFSTSAAQAQDAMQSVLITGARFTSVPELAPIGATVITANEIRRAGVADVNQAIRKIGGVYGRQSLDSSPDFALDLRGFGTNSSQNMVVMLDGVRLSENEQVSATLSSIPIDSVERIEITRGGASVLYGDGATGGVINIVTQRASGKAARGSVYAELGQFGQREARVSVAKTWDGFALDAALGAQRSDNYRVNNEFRQHNFSGGAAWNSASGRIGVRIDSTRQDARFPGALTEAQFTADPRQTLHPNDFGSLDTDRVTAFIETRIGSVDLAADLSQRERTARATYDFGGFLSPAQYTGKQTQFSPRLRQLGKFDGMLNEVVVGIDLIKWSRVTEAGFSQADATQKSKAVYARDEIKFDGPGNARLALGARHELFDKESIDPAPFTNASYRTKQTQNAWELQGSFYAVPKLNLYLKAGQSYRLANVDENSATPLANKPLTGQTSHDLELGATLGDTEQQLTARLFRHKLKDEIFYDPSAGAFGANVNLDPTRRQGIEIDAMTRIGADWRLSAHLQHIQAKFTEGANAGKEMVLVPKNILSARLSWVPADGQSADIGAQWVGTQRYGSVFDNSCPTRAVPAFATLDGRYARKLGAWELALSVLNLTDKQYFSNAFMGFGCSQGVYPANGRQMKISARYDF